MRKITKLEAEKQTLENEVNELRNRVTQSDRAIIELSNELETTKQMAKEAKDGYDKYVEESENQKRKDFNALLLGEIAFQFDRVVVRKVLYDKPDLLTPEQQDRWDQYESKLTINQLRYKALNNKLTAEQMQRWNDFESFCSQRNWYDVDHLITSLKDLKGPGREKQAHLDQTDKDQQTVPMLHTAAEQACRNNSAIFKNFKRLIDCLAESANSDRPLQRISFLPLSHSTFSL